MIVTFSRSITMVLGNRLNGKTVVALKIVSFECPIASLSLRARRETCWVWEFGESGGSLIGGMSIITSCLKDYRAGQDSFQLRIRLYPESLCLEAKTLFDDHNCDAAWPGLF